MKPVILTLRLNRRALAAVTLSDEELSFAQGRHLSSRSERTVGAAVKYLTWLLDLTKPNLLTVDATAHLEGRTTSRILQELKTLAASRGLPLLTVAKPELLTAYGLTPVKSRKELREIVRPFWTELANVKGKVEPFVVDAAAAALYAETRLELERVPI